MSNKYRIEYGTDGSTEITVPSSKAKPGKSANDNQAGAMAPQGMMPPGYGGGPYPYPYREPFRMPAIVNTGLTIVFAAAVFFGAERYAPHEYKPSTLVGGYEASIGSQLAAAQNEETARLEAYQAEVKVAVETQAKQNEMMLQAILQHYQATYDRAKTMTEAANNFQARYLEARISQTTTVQSSDAGIVSISKLIGRGLNLIDPGSGDAALEYAEDLTAGLEAGLTEAAQEGVRVDLTDWAYGLPSPSEVQSLIASVRPVQIPEPPPLARHYNATENQNDSAPQNGGR